MQTIKIIAEIGINHNGQYDQACALIRAAAESGAWGVKFQYRNLDNAYAEDANQIGDELLAREIRRNYLSPESIISLTDLAHTLGLRVGISFFELIDIRDFAANVGRFDFFKSPSVELSNAPLINAMLAYGKPVYISLGCHNEADIDLAFSAFRGDSWTALHCVSNYPVALSNAKLGYLKHMSEKWGRQFGYSSHDENWEVTLIAMSMGASVIERHITFDKFADGLDHTTSSTPEEFARMAMFARNMQLLMAGEGPRVANQGEMLNLQNLGRSYYAKRTIAIGESVTPDKLVFRSPRVGLGQNQIQEYINKSAIREVQQGQVINRSTFIRGEEAGEKSIAFAKRNKISLPVRLHDLTSIERRFPVGAYEFHLSYKEVLSNLVAKQYRPNNLYSIHLPDYINPTQLMDPFSERKDQAEQSANILQRTVNFADALQQHTGRIVPIVGSFSIIHKNIEQFYQQHAQMLEEYRNQGIHIMPQWLPPVAWYFGGSVKLEVVNQPRDVDFIKQYQLPICMDVCHLCMGDSVYEFDSVEVIKSLNGLIQHVHIADAEGIDGEGLQFGEGDPKNMAPLEAVMGMDYIKVIEVWQGHLDEGEGFARALNKLTELFDGRI